MREREDPKRALWQASGSFGFELLILNVACHIPISWLYEHERTQQKKKKLFKINKIDKINYLKLIIYF